MRLTYLRRLVPKLRTFLKYNSNLAQSQTSRLPQLNLLAPSKQLSASRHAFYRKPLKNIFKAYKAVNTIFHLFVKICLDFDKSSEDAGVTVFQGKPSLFPVLLHLARRQGLPASLGSLQGTIRSPTSLHLAFFRGVIWDFEN